MAKNTKVKVAQPGHAEKLTADNMSFSSCNVKARPLTPTLLSNQLALEHRTFEVCPYGITLSVSSTNGWKCAPKHN